MLPAMLPLNYSPKNSYISKQKAKHDDQTLFSPHRCGAGDHRHGDLVADRMRCSSASARPSQAEEAAPPSAQGTSSSAPASASASQILVMQGSRTEVGALPTCRGCAFLLFCRDGCPRRRTSFRFQRQTCVCFVAFQEHDTAVLPQLSRARQEQNRIKVKPHKVLPLRGFTFFLSGRDGRI